MQGTLDTTTRQAEAWRGFLRAHSMLVRELDRELIETHGLPLHEFEVLLLLQGAPDGRLRMSELADRALLSQSGLTRLVDRLERSGFVERIRCSADRRGLYAAITAAGMERFTAAHETHRGGVRRLFLDRLDRGQIEALAMVWETLLGTDAGRDCNA